VTTFDRAARDFVLAKNVTVLEAASPAAQGRSHRHVVDVVHWLERHDISAEAVTTILSGHDAAALYDATIESGCDFLVAGAYGHSRVGEFVFGGVTRELLLSPEYCVLISH
jgi:nucleotide-binding universal stress UspA family protein